MTRPDRHNEVELNWLPSGSITYLLGGQYVKIERNSLGLFWAAVPHQIVDFDVEAPYFVVTVPLTEFLRAGIDRSFINRVLMGEFLIDSLEYANDAENLRRWESDLKSQSSILERAAQLEIRARLLRMSSRIADSSSSIPSLDLSRADQIACYIAKNYQQPLTSESIAAAHEIHPNYAMNLFRKSFGTTITSFVVQHRLTHAQRLLVSTDDSIANVSMEAGFQSLSRFNEAFKQTCGCSPREYRKQHRQRSE